MDSFVLKGNICFSKSRTEIETREQAFLVCKEGRAAGVFDRLPDEYSHLPLEDMGDRLVIPGMVDMHIHAPQFAFRGMSMDRELMDWLNSYTFPEEEKYADTEYARRAYSVFARAMKKSATTRAVIFATCHRPATELLMELMEESGLVTYVGKVNMDREATEALKEESAEMSAYTTFGWINATKGKFKYTKPILTPRFIPSCTDELMEELRQIQMTYGIPVQSHLSESPGEIELVRLLRPNNRFYGEAYNDHDLFGVNDDINTEVRTVMAHCVWSTAEEAALMKKNGVFVAHCPASNMNLSSGIAPIRRYLDMGLRVGLGSDVAGGHSESIFRAITDTIQVSKLYCRYIEQDAKPITFPEAFYMATAGGGKFFGRVGSFAEGFELDAIVLDDTSLESPRRLTLAQRLERAVYLGLDAVGIEAKYVSGRRIFPER